MKQALINISIFRQQANLNKNLPIILFCGNDFLSGYSQSLKNTLIDNSLIYSVINQPRLTGSSMRFRYSNGLVTDDLFVSSNEIPITTMAINTINKPFFIKQISYTISDSSKGSQYFQNINFINCDLFGKTIVDSFTPNMYRNDMFRFNDSVEIPTNIKIEGSKGLAINIIPEANFTVNLSLQIEQ
jgi:hypothetical protein